MPQFDNIETDDPDKILREVWEEGKDVTLRTQLNFDKVKSHSLAGTLAIIFHSPLLTNHLTDHKKLQISLDRKSRGEFVDSVKARRQDTLAQGSGFFKNMLG